jgi:hypothetical protein
LSDLFQADALLRDIQELGNSPVPPFHMVCSNRAIIVHHGGFPPRHRGHHGHDRNFDPRGDVGHRGDFGHGVPSGKGHRGY